MSHRAESVGVVNIRELSRDTGRVLEKVERGGSFLVTRHGHPVAAVTPIDQEALEDFILANAPEFAAGRREADRELASGNTVSLADFLAQHDVE